MTEIITPGVIITLMILIAISIWLLTGKVWQNKVIDNSVKREQLFRYLNALGLVLASKGDSKTHALYYKAYIGFMATVKIKTSSVLANYNKEVVDRLKDINIDERNQKTLKLINCIREDYNIDKGLVNIWVADLTKRPAQQVDSAEASTIAVPPSNPSGSPR
jgi:hypothetical protein